MVCNTVHHASDIRTASMHLLLLITLAACVPVSTGAKETFAEEAVVTPLSDGLVLVHLQFTQQATCSRHCTTFPKAVGQLAAAIPFTSAELSLTQGRWHYHRWATPVVQAKPAGAELGAHFSPTLPPASLPSLWGYLSHALGGLFCASLNFVARPEATAPLTISMQQQGANSTTSWQQAHGSQHGSEQGSQQQQQQQEEEVAGASWVPGPAPDQVLYASLPQEASCTENLTPWLKLLPCRDAAGLGRLLTQRGVVFGADYHSLLVSIDVVRDQQQRPTLITLHQSFTMVLRSPSSSSSSSRRPPMPGTLSDITLAALLGAEAPSACPVAQTSRLLLQLPQQLVQSLNTQQWGELLQPPPYATVSVAAATASTAAAEGEDSQGQDAGDFDSSSSRSPAARKHMRADTWSVLGFDLTPAPDAAAVLTAGGSGIRRGFGVGTAAGEGGDVASAEGSDLYCSPKVFYVYDLHRNTQAGAPAATEAAEASHPEPAAAAAAAAAEAAEAGDAEAAAAAAAIGGGVPFTVKWHSGAAATAAAAAAAVEGLRDGSSGQPHFSVARYITGTGMLHGGMTLQLTAVQHSHLHHSAAGSGHQDSSSSGDGSSIGSGSSSSERSISVCILQVVPWYVRVWLHTLRLTIDGQPTALEDVLLPSYISPAQDRKRPLVLDLCLSVPANTGSITLTAKFTKAFLRMLEHPPDAHRGFDVPPAVLTVGNVPVEQTSFGSTNRPEERGSSYSSQVGQHGSSNGSRSSSGGSSGGSSSRWHIVVAEGASRAEDLRVTTPLMARLMEQRPAMVYSPGLVVPLAVPDFSMPYNVICLTSTVLAIFMGGTLNALLWRPGKDEHDAANPTIVAARKRKKLLRLVVLVVGFGGIALYFDPDLQGEILKQAQSLGLYDSGLQEL